MSEGAEGRPDTAAECLETVATLLTGSFMLIEKLLREKGDPEPGRFSTGNQVQLDLVTWADYLRANPGVDAALMAALSVDEDTPPS